MELTRCNCRPCAGASVVGRCACQHSSLPPFDAQVNFLFDLHERLPGGDEWVSKGVRYCTAHPPQNRWRQHEERRVPCSAHHHPQPNIR